MKRICLVPRMHGVGGMVSFSYKLAAGLQQRGFQVVYDFKDTPYSSVLVIGGTRDLVGLWRARSSGARIVQRLNGMNWLQRVHRTGLRHFLRSEYGNFLLRLIRGRLADAIVYQSQFSKSWWERIYGPTHVPCHVVYNGVDLQAYSPQGPGEPPVDRYRILLVEGSLGGGYELGLESAVRLVEGLAVMTQKKIELVIAGKISPELKDAWLRRVQIPLEFAGRVPLEDIPQLDRSAHLLYSADINAACPNSVVEALACGLPVLSFDTGALAELVTPESGRVVPYGGDPWRLDPPDVSALVRTGVELLERQREFRRGARRRAEAAFGLEAMVEAYLQALEGPLGG